MPMPIQFSGFSMPSLSHGAMPSQAKVSSSVRAFVRAYPVPALAIGIVLAGFVLYTGKRLAAYLGIIEGRQMSKSGEAAQKRIREAELKAQQELPAKLGNPETALEYLHTNLVDALKNLSVDQACKVRSYVSEKTEDPIIQEKWKAVELSLLQLFKPTEVIRRRSPSQTAQSFESLPLDVDTKAQILECTAIMLPVSSWLRLFQCDGVVRCDLAVGAAQPSLSSHFGFIENQYKAVFQKLAHKLTEVEVASLKQELQKMLAGYTSTRSLWQVYHALDELGKGNLSQEVVEDLIQRNQKVPGPFMNYLTDLQIIELSKNTEKYKALAFLSDERLTSFLEEVIKERNSDELLAILAKNFQNPYAQVLTVEEAMINQQNRLVDAFIISILNNPSMTLHQILKEKESEGAWKVPDKLLGILLSGLVRWQNKGQKADREQLTDELQQQLVTRIFTLLSQKSTSLFHDVKGPFALQEAKQICIEQVCSLCPKMLHVILLNLVDVKLQRLTEGTSASALQYSVESVGYDEALITTFLEQLELLISSPTGFENIKARQDLKGQAFVFIKALSGIKPCPRSLVIYARTLIILKELAGEASFATEYLKAKKVLKEICTQVLEGPLKELAPQLYEEIVKTVSE